MDIKSLVAAYSTFMSQSQSTPNSTLNQLPETKPQVVTEPENSTVTLSSEALKLAADDGLVSPLSFGGTQPPPLKPPVQN
jgi:hypothetical protein